MGLVLEAEGLLDDDLSCVVEEGVWGLVDQVRDTRMCLTVQTSIHTQREVNTAVRISTYTFPERTSQSAFPRRSITKRNLALAVFVASCASCSRSPYSCPCGRVCVCVCV